MSEKIKLVMGDWLYNVGIVGLINILQHSDGVKGLYIKENYVEFDVDLLEDFEEKYFRYMIDKYEGGLSWYKIISYADVMRYHENNDFETFGEAELEALNKYIKDVVKYYINSNSYKAAYQLINDELDILNYVKRLEVIKLKKNENVSDKLDDVKNIFNQLKVVIDYCNKPESRKYLAGKNVMYTLIKNAWNGVCFLNPQTKVKDMYIDYREYFIDAAKNYIIENKAKYKYSCFTCDQPMKDFKNDLSFLNHVGFDTSRKSSHVWNFNNDIAVCPICKMVYSCIPAGMTYAFDKGIFINENVRIESAIRINEQIKMDILKETESTKSLTYRGLVQAIYEKSNHAGKYELADIQVVRLENETYKFNILSRQNLKIMEKSKNELDGIISGGFKEINTYFNIYELVIERILNNQNLFTLIHKLLVLKLSNPKDCRFSIQQVVKVMQINFKIMEGMGYMEKTEKDIIKQANGAGFYLREEYRGKGSKDKLNGIAYRLLNALKTSNKNMFMDTLLNCYLYVQKTVPNIFLKALKDDEQFKTIGYAFVTGLIEGKELNKNNKDGGNQDE